MMNPVVLAKIIQSNSIMADKHTADHSKTVCLGIYWPVCDVYIAHTTI